jgi:hypothetical protein
MCWQWQKISLESCPLKKAWCGQAISGTAARTSQVYSEFIGAYIQGLYNTVQVLGGCHCVR